MALINLTPSPNPIIFPHFISPNLSFLSFQTTPRNPRRTRKMRAALREWREYEEAVKRKDLAGALSFLKSIDDPVEAVNRSASLESTRSRLAELGLVVGYERDWEVLDTCLNADTCIFVLEGPRNVTLTVLKSSTGLEVTKLLAKKLGVSGSSSAVLIAFLGGVSFLLSKGIDVRPNLAAILGLAFMDSVFLGGCCLAQISSYWPPNRRWILVHEAGHLLTAYLMGCPILGVILDPIVAMQMGIQGQAGTQFWDEKMANDLANGRLDGTAFDRYCMVLFAGIAAEALVYGEAEGGENDENLFMGICILLQPPLSVAEMSNQARWSVLQSYNLLKWHKHAHRAAVKALENGGSLSVVIRSIEEAMSSSK
ncbi:uncharacterized protein LOC112018373 isoform X2 [Quercus suber]|uniref:uncharacterized protein LOC112018373 isoform X1 n=1 Tax=Quercus suber TaxID=58331 RepID=UPI0032E012BA